MELNYKDGQLKVNLPLECVNCIFTIESLNFSTGEYEKEKEKSVEKDFHKVELGYSFSVGVLTPFKLRCTLEYRGIKKESKELYEGDKIDIKICSEYGVIEKEGEKIIYKVTSNRYIFSKMIYYTTEAGSKIFLLKDIQPEETVRFIINKRGFSPRFQVVDLVKDCVNLNYT